MFSDTLRFSSALVPAAVAGFVFDASDRIVIHGDLGAPPLGRYAVARNIGGFAIVLLQLVSFIWMPRLFAMKDRDARRKVLATSRDGLYVLAVTFAIAIAAGSPVLLLLWAPASYDPDIAVDHGTGGGGALNPYADAVIYQQVLVLGDRTRAVAVGAIGWRSSIWVSTCARARLWDRRLGGDHLLLLRARRGPLALASGRRGPLTYARPLAFALGGCGALHRLGGGATVRPGARSSAACRNIVHYRVLHQAHGVDPSGSVMDVALPGGEDGRSTLSGLPERSLDPTWDQAQTPERQAPDAGALRHPDLRIQLSWQPAIRLNPAVKLQQLREELRVVLGITLRANRSELAALPADPRAPASSGWSPPVPIRKRRSSSTTSGRREVRSEQDALDQDLVRAGRVGVVVAVVGVLPGSHQYVAASAERLSHCYPLPARDRSGSVSGAST